MIFVSTLRIRQQANNHGHVPTIPEVVPGLKRADHRDYIMLCDFSPVVLAIGVASFCRIIHKSTCCYCSSRSTRILLSFVCSMLFQWFDVRSTLTVDLQPGSTKSAFLSGFCKVKQLDKPSLLFVPFFVIFQPAANGMRSRRSSENHCLQRYYAIKGGHHSPHRPKRHWIHVPLCG